MGQSTRKPKNDQLVVWLRAVQALLGIALAVSVAGVVLNDVTHVTSVVASVIMALSLVAVTRAVGLATASGLRKPNPQPYQRRAADRQ